MSRQKYTERAIIIQGEGHVLEGLWHRGQGEMPILIAAPHPKLGGSMDNAVVAEVAFAAVQAGSSTLRFNYRGVGGSQGDIQGDERDLADFQLAADLLLANAGATRYWAAGYSFGSWIATQAALEDERIEGLILVSPVTRMLEFRALAEVNQPVVIFHGSDDELVDPALLADLVESNPRSTLHAIEGADHYYNRGLGTLSRTLTHWLESHRP